MPESNGLLQMPKQFKSPFDTDFSDYGPAQPAEEALKKRREKLATDQLGTQNPTTNQTTLV